MAVWKRDRRNIHSRVIYSHSFMKSVNQNQQLFEKCTLGKFYIQFVSNSFVRFVHKKSSLFVNNKADTKQINGFTKKAHTEHI